MSAWLVSRTHIDLLVRAALDHPDVCEPYDGPDELGRDLWTENLKSVAWRYPADISGGRPGPVGVTDEEIMTYTYSDPGYVLTPSELNGAIRCLDYQSCEHEGWESSKALETLKRLNTHAAFKDELDGPWGWGPDDLSARLAETV